MKGAVCYAVGGPLIIGAVYLLGLRQLRHDCPELFDGHRAWKAIEKALLEDGYGSPPYGYGNA